MTRPASGSDRKRTKNAIFRPSHKMKNAPLGSNQTHGPRGHTHWDGGIYLFVTCRRPNHLIKWAKTSPEDADGLWDRH